jgi:hypothetical protein
MSTAEAIAMPSTKSTRRQSNSTARSNRCNFSIPGTDARRLVWTTQEVIRALIDCTSYCNDCLPRSGNKLIVDPPSHGAHAPRSTRVLRGVEQGQIGLEKVHLGDGGHFMLFQSRKPTSDYARMPDTGTETGSQAASPMRMYAKRPEMATELSTYAR